MARQVNLFVVFAVFTCYFVRRAVCVSKNEPLFLTPYLESGQIAEAQQESRVCPDINGVKSFTGFLTVDKTCGNHLFFWFVPAEEAWEKAPVMLWLTGGPGTSSLYGLFNEVGPFRYENDTKRLVENKSRWTKDFNVIFLDQPVGTGFSFTEKGCYVKTNAEVARQVYSALQQFFTLFPNLQKNNFFLVGDSYSGTYQPAVGVEIDKRNLNSKVKINLKGALLGNPFMDLSCHNYAPYWFELGIIEQESRDAILKYQEIRNNYIRENDSEIRENDSEGANDYEDRIWNEFGLTSTPSIFNILYNEEIALNFKYFVNSEQIRKQIKVGETRFNATSYYGIVGNAFRPEMIVPAIPNVRYLLDRKYLVAFYTGQLDPDCTFSSLVCVVNKLNYQEHQQGKRLAWYVDGRMAGWVRQGGSLVTVVVRDAGHLVPLDRGEVALALVKGLIGSYPTNTLNLS